MKIVLYGAGRRGKACYQFLKNNNYEDMIYAFCDKNANEIRNIEDKKVYLLKELPEEDSLIYCLTIKDAEEKKRIQKELGVKKCIEFEELPELLGVDKVQFNRGFCAYIHEVNMHDYFEKAETEESLDLFWNKNSDFYKMFKKLDLANVIELACGKGRHVSHYMDEAGTITLVDILEQNINICKRRFSNIGKVKFYKNDGYDLKELEANTYTSLFTYDAMVHFELLDIYEYLKDIYRVLKRGGYGLIPSFE